MNNSSFFDGIIYAVFGILALTITAIIWFGKYFATHLSGDLKEHTKAALGQQNSNNKLTLAVKKNTKSNDEVLTFMKNLNGRLAKATSDTLHQTKEARR